MQRDSQSDGQESPRLQRHGSSGLESLLQRRDSRSSISGSSLIPPPQLVPEPAYIASSAASQIVNSEYVSRGPNWMDHEGEHEGSLTVSAASLAMVNAFLDQLLFSFLKGARSTSIIALKPAINDILKPRLAKDAIQGADEELQGYLTGGDDEELSDFHNGQELKGERNLQRIFRRTRLRCMVYTRLGDMEEEDEDMYLESEAAQDPEERHSLANDLGNVSPAAAIFLTSIIEFIGEQALMIAGEAAFMRLGMKKIPKEDRGLSVEESDVEKLAFNTTLGRLWRSWRNRTRPSSMMGHSGRRSMSRSEMTSRATSVSEVVEPPDLDGTPRQGHSMAQILQDDREPADIPLPQPRGFPEEPDFGTDSEGPDAQGVGDGRPRSMMEYQNPRVAATLHLHQLAGTSSPQARPVRLQHQRSASLPTRQTHFQAPLGERFAKPSEAPDPFVIGNEQPTEISRPTNNVQTVQKLSPRIPGVSTMYDGVLGEHPDPQLRTREVSMASDYSSAGATDGSYAHDPDIAEAMTPQALNFKKSQSAAPTEDFDPESRTSTVSDAYSFGDHDAPTGIFGPPSKKKETAKEAGMLAPRGAASDESHPGSSKNFASLATVQGEDRMRTYDERGKAVKRDIPALYEAPSNQNVMYYPKAPARTLHDDIPDIPPAPPAKPHPQGVPPLTPLRELRDAAHDTSDEASSVSAGYDYDGSRSDDIGPTPGYKNADGQRGVSYSSSAGLQNQPSAPATKAVDLRSQPLSVNTGAERAAVQRVSPSPGNARDPTSPQHYGRTSTGSANARPQTAGSASSKLQRIVSRESGELSRQPVPRRTSSGRDDTLYTGQRTGSGARSASKQLDFEDLIKSDETIQYTLTPQNMREMESPNSPRWSQRPELGGPASLTRTTSAEQQASPSSRSPKAGKGLNGLRSNPNAANGVGQNVTDFASPQKKSPTIPQPGSIPKSPNGRQNVMPRDPSIKDSSDMRDFADFIRSTGPDSDPKTMQKSAPSKDRHLRNASNSSEQGGKPLPKKITKQAPVVIPKRPENAAPQRSTSKLKARDPVVTTGNATADLADFLRSGPPGAGVQMDSTRQAQRSPSTQQTSTISNGTVNGRMVSAASIASTQDSFAASKMTQSSSNSRTGLLEASKRAAPVKNTQPQRPSQAEEMGGPVRKQRRVRDPYAIDSEDEEEEDYGLPTQPAQEEESLSDFLRNYTPPPPEATTPRPTPTSITQPPASSQTKERKPGFRDRITRNIAVVPEYRPLPPKGSKTPTTKHSPPASAEKRQPAQQQQQQRPSSQRQTSGHSNGTPSPQPSQSRGRPSTASPVAPQLPPIDARATSPHLISQNGTKMDSYRPTRPTYAAHVDRTRPKPQARDEVATKASAGGGLGDLAEFLRDTEPPAPMKMGHSAVAVGMSPEPKEGGGGGFGRMFGRKRKV